MASSSPSRQAALCAAAGGVGLLLGFLCSRVTGKTTAAPPVQKRREPESPTPAVRKRQEPEIADLTITARMLNKRWSEKKKSKRPELRRPSSSQSVAALTPPSNSKYVLAMVGLPARGKSYIVKMIMRYLRWSGIKAEIFNVGNFRRKMDLGAVPASFFDKVTAPTCANVPANRCADAGLHACADSCANVPANRLSRSAIEGR